MAVGRRRTESEQGYGSGISIGGDNSAPLQNVVGENISNVHQSASVREVGRSEETVRELLSAFRAQVDEHGADLPNAPVLRAVADSIDTTLTAPDTRSAEALRGAVQALPALVAGSVVAQGGEALAQALAGWLG